jgi:hypothetical protein
MNTDYIIRMLCESQERLNKELRECIQSLASEDKADKIKHLKKLSVEIEHFKQSLAKEDYPEWLINITKGIDDSLISSIELSNMRGLLSILIDNASKAFSQKWENDSNIDFEDIYRAYRKESRLEELFNKLIDLLTKIMKDGNLEDDIVRNGINRIIEIIKVNEGRSIFSDISLIDFISMFLKNVALEVLKKIPGMDIIIKSLETTLKEINNEIDGIKIKTADKIVNEAKVDVRYLSNGKKVTYELPRLNYLV